MIARVVRSTYPVARVRERSKARERARKARRRVRVGVPDATLTGCSGIVAVSELFEVLGVVEHIDAAVPGFKSRDRGLGPGGLLVGIAAAQLTGQDFLVGLDRHRADAAGQALTPVPDLATTTATGLARRMDAGRWLQVETGIAAVHERMLALLPVAQADALCAQVTLDLDATDVEVYGPRKQGMAYNYQGQRCGRPHVATWAETATVLAADLTPGNADPRAGAVALLGRALAGLPARARTGRIAMRTDAGYFAGELARAAHEAGIDFAIGAKRIAPLWRLLSGITEDAWNEAIDMPGAQVTVADYRPDWWPANTHLLIRRVELDAVQVSADPRSRRRRTLHPDQRALPVEELGQADAIYAYSFIATNIELADITDGAPQTAVQVEHWYRHRTSIENCFRDAKHGAALDHLPSGHEQVNTAWMWGALLAVSTAGWLHQLTTDTDTEGNRRGWGTRGGQAMIATLRHRLICVPGRLVRSGRVLTLRLPPGHHVLAEVLARLRALPATT